MLSWAVYLGMSWTWCIGMFMPVILVTEFGLSMWFIFAIPNVLGAAAMGWVLAKPGSSEKLVADHRAACVVFTVVTLAFQAFFLVWLASAGLIPVPAAIAAGAAGLVGGEIFRRRSVIDLTTGWAVLAVSIVVLVRALISPKIGDIDGIFPEKAAAAWIGLTPACVLGFLLCPYLDVTFHRARQELPPPAARRAFGLGFGVFFLAMIVLTLLYTGDVSGHGGSFGRAFPRWVGTYMAIQIGFTWMVHLRAVVRPRFSGDRWVGVAAAALAVGAAALAGTGDARNLLFVDPAKINGPMIYRLFMSFYGLVFPAYVWVCVLPWRKHRQPTGWSLTACAIVIAAAAPLYWAGFMMERWIWLPPAVVIVLAGGPLRRVFPEGKEIPARHGVT
jgi:hypothetical protein